MQPNAMVFPMKTFLIRQRRLTSVFAILLGWLLGFELWHRETFTAPLKAPIALSLAGKVEQDIRIRLEAPHELRIDFSAGTRPRDEAMQLVGRTLSCGSKTPENRCDVAVPLRWSLTDPSGKILASGEGETHGITSWGSTDFTRTVARSIRLPVGRYRFSASVLRDIPEFDGMIAHLSFGLPGLKTSYGWQSDLAFFGGLLNFFLILPMIGSFGMILLGQAVADWAGKRRKS